MRFVGCLWFFAFVLATAQESNIAQPPDPVPEEGVPAVGTNVAPWLNRQPPLLWRARLGVGFSGMFVTEDRVYTQMQTRAGQYVVCLDLDSGRLLWRTRSNLPWEIGGDFPGPYATPVCKSGKVYYADCYGQAGCLDARNGKTLWAVNLTEKLGGEGPGFGYACSPLVDDEKVILPVGGRGASVVACSTRDGSVVWKSGDDAASYSSPLSIQVQSHRQVVSFLQHALVAKDPLTGHELWRDRWSASGYDQHNTAPVYQEPYLFCSTCCKRGARVLKLGYEKGTAKAELAWASTALCNDIYSSVIVRGYIYGSGLEQPAASPTGRTRSQFKCVELATGRVAWSSEAPGHASVLSYDNKLFLVNESGVLIVIEPSPTGYMELARSQVVEGEKPCWTTPTISQGRLLVRNQETLACFQIGVMPAGTNTGPQAKGLDPTTLADHVLAADFNAQIQDRSLLDEVFDWLDQHHYSAYWIPFPAIMARWFGWCVALLGLAAGLAWVMQRFIDPWLAFLVLSIVIGILGLPISSVLTGQLVFTWPVACHSGFVLLLTVRNGPLRSGKIMSRVCLALFATACVGYYFVCRQLYLLFGTGFLAGFLPAWPAALWFARMEQERPYPARMVLTFILSFSLCFWGAALIILWRMGR
ncbi:MAG: PQQ-binding-like beta-propeller repeat protein [Verrucomicrobiota bacterium]|jgi:outer membrane protein assembly factor BamB